MSLFRQLWLAVICSMIIAFAGSFVVSMLTARNYLENQLAVKNSDNASSLALSMSQLAKDDITIELQVAALVDSGQYALVRIVNPEGKTLIERVSPPENGGVPAWFINLFPIESRPGQAQISTGWTQFGTVQLVSHNRFAYEELWNGCLKLLLWFVGGGAVLGLLGMRLLNGIKRPLDAVVGQARAISERRFITIPEPKAPELKSVTHAMNAMVERLKAMFAEEAARLERMRREATLDGLTGLANRAYFMNQLDMALKSDDLPPSGLLFLLRVGDLMGLNKRSGREVADEALRRIGKAFTEVAVRHPDAIAARLNGADFALILPGLHRPDETAEHLLEALRNLVASGLTGGERIGHVASGVYHHEEDAGSLLARLDAALASAEGDSPLAWRKADSGDENAMTSHEDWKNLLESAIDQRRLRLVEFPVVDKAGQMLHMECPLRLQPAGSSEWLAAGSFMPIALRLAMTAELDMATVSLALERLAAGTAAIAVNLSGESVAKAEFRTQLHGIIKARPELARRLWLEIPETGAFEHFTAFREFCRALQPLGCRLGIEHFGRRFSEIGQLHDVGLDYLKVDGSFIRGIDHQPGNQAFLKGLCAIAGNIGLIVLAEGVTTPWELALLPDLGFYGATGPAVRRQ